MSTPPENFRNALRNGAMLHWYRIERVLGQGGFGITYLAYDNNLHQQVAIKEYLPMELAVREGDNSVYPASQQHDERFHWGLERFLTEARTLAKFRHPAIVRVHSVFEANNTAYMVMEYEQGETLQEKLARSKTLDGAEIDKILIPILDGLEQMHSGGFIHRDIKPANIFLRGNGSAVLIDFGSARQALGMETRTLTSVVSPGYAPYEQYFSRSDRQGPWTDIYGVAATLYRAISGRAPANAIDRSEAILKAQRDVMVSAVEIGQGRYRLALLTAIDYGLRFNENERPQSIGEWREQLAFPTAPNSLPSAVPAAAPWRTPKTADNAATTVVATQYQRATPASGSRLWRGVKMLVMMALMLLIAIAAQRAYQRHELRQQKNAVAETPAPVAVEPAVVEPVTPAPVIPAPESSSAASSESAPAPEPIPLTPASGSAEITPAAPAVPITSATADPAATAADVAAVVAPPLVEDAVTQPPASEPAHTPPAPVAMPADENAELLAQAEKDLRAGRMNSPRVQKVIERAQARLQENPQDRPARRLLQQAGDRYAAQAQSQIKRGNLDRAAALLEKADTLGLDNNKLDAAADQLRDARAASQPAAESAPPAAVAIAPAPSPLPPPPASEPAMPVAAPPTVALTFSGFNKNWARYGLSESGLKDQISAKLQAAGYRVADDSSTNLIAEISINGAYGTLTELYSYSTRMDVRPLPNSTMRGWSGGHSGNVPESKMGQLNAVYLQIIDRFISERPAAR